MSFIQNLQKKTDNQKKVILFSIVGIFMVFIFGIWCFQFKKSLEVKTIKQNNNLVPMIELTENIVNTYKDSTEKIEEIKEIFKEKE